MSIVGNSARRLVMRMPGITNNHVGLVPKPLIDMMRISTSDWTPDSLSEMISSDTVPTEYIETAVTFLGEQKSLLGVQKPEFLAAIHIARPDLYAIVASQQGDRWLDTVSLELSRALVNAGLKWLGIGR